MYNINIEYVGFFNIENNNYKVFEDKENNLVDIFYTNYNNKCIECWGINRIDVDNANGNSLLSRAKSHWLILIQYSETKKQYYGIQPLYHIFPFNFFEDK